MFSLPSESMQSCAAARALVSCPDLAYVSPYAQLTLERSSANCGKGRSAIPLLKSSCARRTITSATAVDRETVSSMESVMLKASSAFRLSTSRRDICRRTSFLAFEFLISLTQFSRASILPTRVSEPQRSATASTSSCQESRSNTFDGCCNPAMQSAISLGQSFGPAESAQRCALLRRHIGLWRTRR